MRMNIKINIVIPKIVIEELIKQYIEDYRYKYENLDSKVDVLLNACSKIGWDIKINKKIICQYQNMKNI